MGNTIHLTEEEIAICAEALNNGTLNQIKPKLITHLQECDHCLHEVSFLSEMISSNPEESTLDIDFAFHTPHKEPITIGKKLTIISLIAGVAASLLILFIPVSKDFFSRKQYPNENFAQNMLKKKNNSIEDSLQTDKLAYTPNKNLEKLVSRYTNSNLRGNDPKDI